MTKKKLENLAERYQKKADRAYQNYQETGITRYGTAYRSNEELADALRMAAYASEDHAAFIAMRGQMAEFCLRADAVNNSADSKQKESNTMALLRDMVAYGHLTGFIRREAAK